MYVCVCYCASDVLCTFYKFRLRHLSINVDLRAVQDVLSHSIPWAIYEVALPLDRAARELYYFG